MSSTGDQRSFLQGLQGLRYLAALAVLFHHGYRHFEAMGGGQPWLAAFDLGFCGADVFFVISGVIMFHTTRTQGGLGAGKTFLVRRLARLFTGYWPVLAFALWVQPAARARDDWNVWGSLFLLEPDHSRQFIFQAWSLVYELYFYGLWTLVVALVPPKVRAWVALAAVGVLAASNAWLLPEGGPFWASKYLLEFGAGALLAAFAPRARWPGLVAAALVVAGGLGLWWGAVGSTFNGVVRVVTFGVFATGAVGAVFLVDLAGRRLAPRALATLGDASYALYLWHVLAFLAFSRSGLEARLMGWPWTGLLVVATGATLWSLAWYRFVERPLLRVVLKIALDGGAKRGEALDTVQSTP